jgi:predicted Fe-Mo cluster-binding NifX family protein
MTMKIVVTSQNYRTVTPHAGRTRRFLVYRAEPAGEPVEIDRLDLPKDMAMHEFHREGAHSLDAVDVVIAGSFGDGFARRMAKRGVRAVTTEKTDPVEAVREFLAHPERSPRPHGGGGQTDEG